jgi:hypothetical protein
VSEFVQGLLLGIGITLAGALLVWWLVRPPRP